MSSISSLIIDNQDFTSDIISDSKFVLEVSKDSTNGVVNYTASEPIRLSQNGYDYLKPRFKDACGSGSLRLPVIISLDCCSLSFEFETNVETLDFSLSECEVSVILVQVPHSIKLYEDLRKFTWWQDSQFQIKPFPRLKYIREPSVWKQIIAAFVNFNNSRHHYWWICPYVWDILQYNIVEKGGSSFVSNTIFEQYGEYKKMGYSLSTFEEGFNVNKNPVMPFDESMAPVETTVDLLNKLKIVFNADYLITSNKVQFERKDFWRNEAPVLFDLIEELNQDNIEGDVNISLDPNKNYAYGRYEWTDDTVDIFSRRAKWQFSDLIEWNPTGETNRRGSREVTAPFTVCHQLGDLPYIKSFNKEDDNGGSDLDRNIEYRIWNDTNGTNERMLWTQTGITQTGKLVMINPEWETTGQLHALAQDEPIDISGTGYIIPNNRLPKRCNWQLSFREDEPEGLYQRFHFIDDPRITTNYSVSGFKWFPSDFCSIIQTVVDSGLNIAFNTEFGKGIPESLIIDFDEKSIVFENPTVEKNC